MKFSIRDLLWLSLVVAVVVAWRVEWQASKMRHRERERALKMMVVETDLKAQETAAKMWEIERELEGLRAMRFGGGGPRAARPRPVPKAINPNAIRLP
jgi:hypothetical protein